jgi:3-mercaptopyruvate sulfurtransferase SseA
MTAAWLVRMGWSEVAVYPCPDLAEGAQLETGPWRPTLPDLDGQQTCEAIAPAALADRLEDPDLAVIDLGRSTAYRDGHIPGAYFAVRARLADSLQRLPAAGTIVLTADDEMLARLAAPEVAAITGRATVCLDGGNPAWQQAELPLETGWTRALDEADDVHLRPYDRAQGVEQAMRDYLAWEIDLLERVAKDGTLSFKI